MDDRTAERMKAQRLWAHNLREMAKDREQEAVRLRAKADEFDLAADRLQARQ